MEASVIIRTYNEARWLESTLNAVSQQSGGIAFEIILVDSGSDDGTVEIAKAHGCRIERIAKSDFTFGRSLNIGCAAARGNALVFLSGHCIPTDDRWLQQLIHPLGRDSIAYTYGRQIGREGFTKFSEEMVFRKYFPDESAIPQIGFFCNNANSALLASVWKACRFDEDITGLEDLHLAKKLTAHGNTVAYVAEAAVEHIHEETWSRVMTRYEREAMAMQTIMPEVQFGFLEATRYAVAGILIDLRQACREGVFKKRGVFTLINEIIRFRICQYVGTYKGAHSHRKLSRSVRERYYYPH